MLDYSDYDLECDVLYDGKYMSRKTPLFLAAESGRSDIINFLLNNSKVDVNKMAEFDLLKVPNEGDPEKKTPLYIAFENMKIDAIKALLNHDYVDVNLLNEIYKEGKCISYEVFEGTYVSYSVIKHRKAVLHYAVENNLIEYVKILLDSPKTDVNLLCETCSTFWNTTSRSRMKYFSDIEEVVDIEEPFDENEVEKQAAFAHCC